MSRGMELLATTAAAAFGALLAVLAVGASLLLVVPAALGVGLITLVARR